MTTTPCVGFEGGYLMCKSGETNRATVGMPPRAVLPMTRPRGDRGLMREGSRLRLLITGAAFIALLLASCGSSASESSRSAHANGTGATSQSADRATTSNSEEDPGLQGTPCHVTGTVDGTVQLTIDAEGELRGIDDPGAPMQNFGWKGGGYTFLLTHNADYPHAHGGFIEDGDDFLTGGYGITYQPAELGPEGGTAEGEYFRDPGDDEFSGTFSFKIECGS